MKIAYINKPTTFISIVGDSDEHETIEDNVYTLNGRAFFLNNGQSINYITVTEEQAQEIIFLLDLYGNFNHWFEIKDDKVNKTINTYLFGLKEKRNKLLEESDRLSGIIYADIWAALSEELQTEWTTYRSQLRDLPDNATTIEEFEALVWPSAPQPALAYINNKKQEEILKKQEEILQARLESEAAFLANLNLDPSVTPE